MTFEPGQRVTVKAITGTVTRRAGLTGDGYVTIQEKGTGNLYNVPEKLVELITPEHWPPQAGDVWVTPDDRDWYTKEFSELNGVPGIRLETFHRKDQNSYGDPLPLRAELGAPGCGSLDDFMRLKPKLVRRRDLNFEP